jgi:peptidoglycan/xylan/chitin deacetylase (PgdA/CDA1 family)
MSERSGLGAGPRVALTFDAEHADRPSWRPDVHHEVVKLLDGFGITATFFLQGRWAEANPVAARRIADAGHLIGNHSFYHARMPLLTDAGIRADVEGAEHAIVAASGVDSRPWFRCPFGAGANDPRVIGCLASLGYRNVDWDVEPKEWEPGTLGDDVVRFVLDGVEVHGDGSIVLLHTWPEATRSALPGIVAGLLVRGASFVTLAGLDLDARSDLGQHLASERGSVVATGDGPA